MDNHNIEVASQAEDKQIVASSPCTEFTVFPNLPQELKDRIWKFASPGKDIKFPLTTQAILQELSTDFFQTRTL